ncbi:ABC transporter ATP-binding protein [Paenibacillus sp. H1-7]|uniref:ABC transporter ATP-binding protein n=1 Tax=Paenibacillus sp. H1-7 TaxID=2282849 RepID=UPI001EF83581|nr:ABC transporter ATP-binding protein [Paenibacillus sp. H1-7]ULL18466.1 ABC transporter ATP-binding protein [Paenibacillus sp. H1-7]
MLNISDLHVRYDAVHALRGVSMEVRQGETVAVIGSNGAGKTTLMNAIIGMVKPSSGSIMLGDASIASLPAYRTFAEGVSLVPERREVFGALTVLENLKMGLSMERKRFPKTTWNGELEAIFARFPRLRERMNQTAGTLSGGEQQMLTISRALIRKPKLLLLDEPSLGLAPIVVNDIFQTIKGLKEEGVTIVLVEQLARKALAVADRAYVLENGAFVMHGPAQELQANDNIAKAYLGG